MKKDEAWLEKIKERLDEYTEPVPSGGWERLERDLPPARKVVPLRRWMTAVAALLVGAVSFIAIRLADKPVPDEPAALESPVLARHLSPVTASPGPEADALPDRAGTDERLPIVARIERAEAVQTEQTEAMQSPEPDESTGDTRHPSPVTPSPAPKANPRKENRKKKATELPPADQWPVPPASAEALFDWFRNNAGDISAIHRELPFSHKLKSGQVVNGRIDMMVEMKDRHCLLVDYKTARTEKEYAPQMLLYKRALEADGFAVDHCYIFYPISGQLDEIVFTEEESI